MLDPGPDAGDFLLRERLILLRHLGFVARDHVQEDALVGLARHDRRPAVAPFEHAASRGQREVSLGRRFAVAVKAPPSPGSARPCRGKASRRPPWRSVPRIVRTKMRNGNRRSFSDSPSRPRSLEHRAPPNITHQFNTVDGKVATWRSQDRGRGGRTGWMRTDGYHATSVSSSSEGGRGRGSTP